jgi:hypothetical protein
MCGSGLHSQIFVPGGGGLIVQARTAHLNIYARRTVKLIHSKTKRQTTQVKYWTV